MNLRFFTFITLWLFLSPIYSQSNVYSCPECSYISFYDSIFSSKPYHLIKKGPFFKDIETTKQTIYDLTSIANQKSNNEVTEFLFAQATEYFKDSVYYGIFCNQKSFLEHRKGNSDSSLFYDYKSIELLEAKNHHLVFDSYFSLAQTLFTLDSIETGIKYGELAFESIHQNYKTLHDSLVFTSICYILYAEYRGIKNFEKAEFFFQHALNISKKTNNDNSLYLLNNIIIRKLLDSKKNDSAYYLAKENIEFAKKSGFNINLSYAYINSGKTLQLLNKTDKANLYFDSVINDDKFDLSHKVLALKYKILTTDSIKSNLNDLLHLKDSLNSLKNQENITKFSTKFETKRIQKENEILQKENLLKEQQIKTRNISIIAIIIIMIGFLYWILERRKRKQLQTENKLLTIEQKLLRTQMNPHFIFNSLSSIQNVISSGDNEKAEEELSNFAVLMRQILDSSRSELIEIDTEISLISTYLKIQKTILGGSFNYILNIENDMDQYDILLPPILIQPFVENAIKYGEPVNKINIIQLNLKVKKNRFIYEIINSGKWLDKSTKQQSHSINITKERIYILNQNRKDYIHFFIEKTPKVKITFSFKID